MVGMEARGCRSGLHSIDIEAGQHGILSEFDVGEMGKFGGATDKADGEVEGALTLVLEPVGLPDAIQSEHYRVEGRKGDGCLGGDVEEQQLLGQRDELFYKGHPREMEGSKSLSTYVVKNDSLLQAVGGGEGAELEEFGPLSLMPLAVKVGKEPSLSVSPRWVVERVKDYYKLVGLSCDRYEDKLLALFEEIEATRNQTIAENMATATAVSGVKGQREIKRLDCSINYDKKGDQSNRRRGKGGGFSCLNEA